jgi:hypothetical protein
LLFDSHTRKEVPSALFTKNDGDGCKKSLLKGRLKTRTDDQTGLKSG